MAKQSSNNQVFIDALNASEVAWHNAMNNATAIDALKSSTLFNLSLGSKELFHSNFLAWIFETYPHEFGKMLSAFLGNSEGDTTITAVQRELKNRDLTITFANGQQLVIENKVKSLPYIEQLVAYAENAGPNQNFLLLSLVPPQFARDGLVETGNTTWRVMSYADLANLLSKPKVAITSSYHAAMLVDYVGFIRAMSDLFSSNTIDANEPFASVLSRDDNEMLKRLDAIRTGDVYQKLRCEALAVQLHQKLTALYHGHAHIAVPAPERVVDDIYVGHGMTNSTGLIEASYVVAPGLFLTVQIQGNSYRQMVQGYAGYGKDARRVADRLRERKLWFDFANIGTDLKEYPRGEKPFNGYAGVDFYRSVTIPPEVTVEKVLDAVTADIERIVFHRAKIAASV